MHSNGDYTSNCVWRGIISLQGASSHAQTSHPRRQAHMRRWVVPGNPSSSAILGIHRNRSIAQIFTVSVMHQTRVLSFFLFFRNLSTGTSTLAWLQTSYRIEYHPERERRHFLNTLSVGAFKKKKMRQILVRESTRPARAEASKTKFGAPPKTLHNKRDGAARGGGDPVGRNRGDVLPPGLDAANA